MKRLFCIAIAAVMILLTACTPDVSNGDFSDGSTFNKGTFVPSGEKISSSIFGRNVKYDSWSIKEGLTLPVDSSEIIDTFQIEKLYFIHTAEGVFSLNLETGESGKIIDSVDFASYYEDKIYTYTLEDARLCTYSTSGELLGEQTVAVEAERIEAKGLMLTEDYYVFIMLNNTEYVPFMHYDAYDRETLERVTSVKENLNGGTIPYHRYSIYKGNSFLKLERDSAVGFFNVIKSVDLETGKTKTLADVYVGDYCSGDLIYNPKTDTVIVFTGPLSLTTQKGEKVDVGQLRIAEYSLSDPDNVDHKHFYFELKDGTDYYVGVFENIITAISTADNEVRYFDYLNPPESITLACGMSDAYKECIAGFEKETGILVKTVNYGYDYDRLDIKLMAGDTDFDLYNPTYYNMHKYFTSGAYEDLAKYPELKSRLDGDVAAGYAARLGDTYVGMPTYVLEYYSEESKKDGDDPRQTPYSLNASRAYYCAYYLDVTTGEYLDPDGEELYKLLKFWYDYPEGNIDKMPFGNDCNFIATDFLIINPGSLNKENAAKFLAYMFDALNGDIEGVVPEEEQYIDFETTENVYLYWHSFAWSYVEPIYQACNRIAQCDGKASIIKEIAREAAMQTRMRLSE